MKQIVKNLVSDSLIRRAKKIIGKRKYPVNVQYKGPEPNVLQCRIAYNEFGGYCIPLSSYHRPASQKILSGKVYEAETIEYIVTTKSQEKGDIIHAGTYFGDFLPALSRACTNGEKVWAFEPNTESYRCALITTIINDLKNVVLTNAALGAENGSYKMKIADETGRALGGGSRLIKSDLENSKGQFIVVKMIKIDEFIPSDRKIAIIQLDVEGFEKSALQGAMSTIKRNKPILILENLPEEEWLDNQIFQLGYRLIKEVCENKILVPE